MIRKYIINTIKVILYTHIYIAYFKKSKYLSDV